MNFTKNKIRLALLKKLKSQKEVGRLKRSFSIQKKLFSLPEFIKAKVVLFYLSFNGEVETLRMIEKAISLGKKVAVPVTDRQRKKIKPSLISDCGYDLEAGAYGILQPKHGRRRDVPLRKIDLVVVPAVAFDPKGNRIGRGTGYYDRFLAELTSQISENVDLIKIIGIGFKEQMVEKLPIEDHDYQLNDLLLI